MEMKQDDIDAAVAAMVEHSESFMTLILDEEGDITWANTASLRVLGYTPADLQGRDSWR